MHILDKISNLTRIELGPLNYILRPNEQVVGNGIQNMMALP